MMAPIGVRDLWHRAIAATSPRSRFLRSGPVGSRSVCLTFDDGPHPVHTPRLLDVLSERGVVATFFLVGREARRYPAIVRRIVAEGHSVGNHTDSHPEPGRISRRQLLDEVRRAGASLSDLTGREIRSFRPPYGRLSPPKLLSLWRSGQTVVLWNADPKDHEPNSAGRVQDWFRSRPPRSGDLILMHDVHPLAADILPGLESQARARSLTFLTVDAWIT